MAHGALLPGPGVTRAWVYPGPLLKVWVDRVEVAALPLGLRQALDLANALQTAVYTRLPPDGGE